MGALRNIDEASSKRRPPASTPQGRERQLQTLAFDLAERQLREGTASAQVITHFLKSASERDALEKAKLANENALLEAKREMLASEARIEELYEGAIRAMTRYNPNGPSSE